MMKKFVSRASKAITAFATLAVTSTWITAASTQAQGQDYFKEADESLVVDKKTKTPDDQGDSLEAPAPKSAQPQPTITIKALSDKPGKIRVCVDNFAAFDKALFTPASYLQPFQQNANASRAIVYIRKSTSSEPLVVYDMLRDPHELQRLTLQKPDGESPVLVLDIWDRMSDLHHVSLPTALRLDNH
jgi:hypothetical protein